MYFLCKSRRRGGRDINIMLRSHLILERTGWSVRRNPTNRSDLTTPSARNKVALRLLIDRASALPLRGGGCSRSNSSHREFIEGVLSLPLHLGLGALSADAAIILFADVFE